MACFRNINSVAMSFIAFPLTNILFSFFVSPETISLHSSILKITHIILISKLEPSLAMSSVVVKITKIDGSIGKLHITFTHFVVKAELTLIHCINCEFHSIAMLRLLISPTEVELMRMVINDAITSLLIKLFFREKWLIHLIVSRVRKGRILVINSRLFWVVPGDDRLRMFDFWGYIVLLGIFNHFIVRVYVTIK